MASWMPTIRIPAFKFDVRLITYLLQRYFGSYLETKLESSQVSADLLSQGVVTLTNVRLDVNALNELGKGQNWAFEIVEGRIEEFRFCAPSLLELFWSLTEFLSKPIIIEIVGLKLRIQPKAQCEPATSMFESMWSSVTSSILLAEEFTKGSPPDVVPKAEAGQGLQALASGIDNILNLIQVKLVNTVLQFEYVSESSPIGVGIVFNVESISYADESNPDAPKDDPESANAHSTSHKSHASKRVTLEGVTVSTVEFPKRSPSPTRSDTPQSYMTDDDEEEEDDDSYDDPPTLEKEAPEENVILCGIFYNKIEILVQLKYPESMNGVKVSAQMAMGSVLFFFSPRQFHLLTTLANGLVNPERKSSIEGNYAGRPMTEEDYIRIQKDLHQQLSMPIQNFQLPGGSGWATGASDYGDFEEDFLASSPYEMNSCDRAPSPCSTLESSISSSMSFNSEITGRTRRRLNKQEKDPTAAISHFEVEITSFGAILLHEEVLIERSGEEFGLVPSSVSQMQSTAINFFDQSSAFASCRNFASMNALLDKSCQSNHLRLLSSTIYNEVDETNTSRALSISSTLEAIALELSECLYDNSKQTVQHVDLVTFGDKNAQFDGEDGKSSLKVQFKHIERNSTVGRKATEPRTSVTCYLDECKLECDITMVDRISALLNHRPFHMQSHSNKMEDPSISNSDSKIEIKVVSPRVDLRLRFPKPDFRPHNDFNRIPWWTRNVRSDFLSLVFHQVSFETSLQSIDLVQSYLVYFKNSNIAYHENANVEPIPIAKAGFEEKLQSSMQNILMDCKLHIKINPNDHNNSKEVPVAQPDPLSISIAGYLESNRKQCGPFSGKRVVHESDTPHHRAQSDKCKELLIPGDKHEINEFIKTTSESVKIQLDVFLSHVSVQLMSKHLYEVIYNRINNDLLLWESSVPKTRQTTPNYSSSCGFDVDDHEVYSMCRTAVGSDSASNSDNDENASMYYSTFGSRLKNQTIATTKPKQSFLTFSLHIGHGLLSMFPPVRDSGNGNVIPGLQAEFLISLENTKLFLVSGHSDDPGVGYLCVETENAQLHHCEMMTVPSKSPPLKDIGSNPGQHLHKTVYKSEQGMLANFRNRGGDRDLLTLCLKIQERHETHQIKTVSLAVGFNKATLRHRMCSEPNSWISQLLDFFNVKDYSIPGYTTKEILTELHVHLWDSAIDYRPIYLPLRSAITMGTFSISSHLSADVHSSTLRFIAEEVGLFISQKGVSKNVAYLGPVDLRKDYVNVIELGLFDISLKTSNKYPHFDLRASNNIIEIRTCADSAKALTKLITYFAEDGDLTAPEDVGSSCGSNYSSPRHECDQKLVDVNSQEMTNISKTQQEQIKGLLTDALMEEEPKQPKAKRSSNMYDKTLFYFPAEAQQDQAPILSQVTTELGNCFLREEQIDSDEEYCFIDKEAGYVLPKDGEPEIRWLTDEPVRLIENHFCVPNEKSDPLSAPKNFPTPEMKYTLCDMTIVWSMFGGSDFTPVIEDTKRVNFSETVHFSKSNREKVVIECMKEDKRKWLQKGGPNRDHNMLMELKLSKIRFLHEVYPDTSDKASRQVLIISDIEVRDKLHLSRINKFLYEYTSEARPKQSNANMLVIKTVHTRPDPQVRIQECCVKISLLPLRLNVDQHAFLFLSTFFSDIGNDTKEVPVQGGSSKYGTPVHQPPVMSVSDDNELKIKERVEKIVDEDLMRLLDEDSDEDSIEERPSTSSSSTEETPIYFRKVIFSPDVPIRLDYMGQTFDMTHGPLPGIFMGLANLQGSELHLKRIVHRHGLLGFDKLISFILREWLTDIKKNQLPGLLSGVGPMNALVQLFQGIRDLFFLPFEQYKKDGRFFRGLHRGANSFTTSTAMAALELTSRLIHLIQITAETAFDMLTPGPSVRMNPKTKGRRKRYSLPKDIREGVTNAYKVVKEGIEETADNIVQVATHEHEQKGYSGAVGGVIRQIPPTILKPIIIASEATNNVLGGMRCQLVPGARKDARDKWRNDDAGL